VSELNSQLTQKNSDLSVEIDQLKVIPCFIEINYVLNVAVVSHF